ncbi:MAG: ArsR/SmtB family transcription factor [Geminicoccales bacterium]
MKTDSVTATFAALADPTRRAILARLSHGEASVSELSEPFPMSMPAISKHLKILEKADLITRTKSAQWRQCNLRPEGFRIAAAWLQDYERFWSESFDRLAEHLTRAEDPDRHPTHPIEPSGGKGRQDDDS